MKGVGWIVVLLGLLGAVYLVARDVDVLSGKREGKTVVEPMEQAKEAADAVRRAQEQMSRGLKEAER